MYNYIFSKCRNSEMAEDVTQTAFLKAIEKADSFRNESSVVTWLFKIAYNALLNELERHENKNLHLEDLDGNGDLLCSNDDILVELIKEEEKANLYKTIHLLDEKQKELVLYRLIGLSFREIGRIFNQSEVWARVNFYRAKEELLKKWETNNL